VGTRKYFWYCRAILPCAALLVLGLAACDTNPPKEPAPLTDSLFVEVDQAKDDLTLSALAIYLVGSSTILSDPTAEATINGQALSFVLVGYGSSSLTPVLPGDAVNLHFSYEDVTVDRSLTMPVKPVPTVPGGSHNPTQAVTVSWTALNPAPDYVLVIVQSFDTVSGETFEAQVDGTATSAEIPGNTMSGDFDVTVVVQAMNGEQSLKDADLGLATYSYTVANKNEVLIDVTP
jgi:hypothetical protein